MSEDKSDSKQTKSTNIRVRSYQFSLTLIRFVNTLPNTSHYFVFRDQLVRSGTSIGANIAEAQGSSSTKDFIKYYEIALKSAYETVYWLQLLGDSYDNFRATADPLLNESQELCKMLGSGVLTLKQKLNLSDI